MSTRKTPRFRPSWFRATHTLVAGVDLGVRPGQPTAIVMALAMPERAVLLDARHGVWTVAEIQKMVAGAIVGTDFNGEALGGHTIKPSWSRGIDWTAMHVERGLWSFPAQPSAGVDELKRDALQWDPARGATKLLTAWWVCDALIQHFGLCRQPERVAP